jgi:putative integral membrane protein (TIGR02587 family)
MADATAILRREGAYLIALARAAAGALLFALPLLMTQEMWQLGAALDPYRLLTFLLLAVPLLTGLTWYAGFREEVSLRDALLDAFAAYAVAFMVSIGCLLMLGRIELWQLALADLGTVAIQAVPAAFGAALAQSQLGGVGPERKKKRESSSYWAELFLMIAGALFIAFNIAPTEEVQIITHGLVAWQCLVIVAVSLVIMHAFVYGVDFLGQESQPEHRGFLGEFVLYTIVGYVLALLVCLYVLWVMSQIDDQNLVEILKTVVTLGFPAALGASAARLIL